MWFLNLRGGTINGGSHPGGYGLGRRLFNLIGATLLLAATIHPAASESQPTRLLLLGDSLTAGYGLPPDEGFVAQLGRALKSEGADVILLDAGVSGDTTAGGRARIAWSLADKPTHALIALGANDALRGLPPEAAQANLQASLEAFAEAGVPVLLAGMQAPRNWGQDYADAFDGIYPALAEAAGVKLYPFFLEGVALNPALNQADGIHPNAAGVAVMVENLTPWILQLLAEEPGA